MRFTWDGPHRAARMFGMNGVTMAVSQFRNHLVLLLLGICLVGLPGRAVADDGDYGSQIMTRTTVTVDPRICSGRPAVVTAQVSSDVDASGRRADAKGGRLRFSLDGEVIAVKNLRPNNTARVVIDPARLSQGTHTVRGTWLPPSGSPYAGSSDSARFVVGDCNDTQAGDAGDAGDDDGILPGTGGPAWWLLLLAALLLALGGYLETRRRRS